MLGDEPRHFRVERHAGQVRRLHTKNSENDILCGGAQSCGQSLFYPTTRPAKVAPSLVFQVLFQFELLHETLQDRERVWIVSRVPAEMGKVRTNLSAAILYLEASGGVQNP